MTHIFSTGLNQMRHLVHLSQKYDTNERQDGQGPGPGVMQFLAVRLAVSDPSPPGQLYEFPAANSPSLPRRFKVKLV